MQHTRGLSGFVTIVPPLHYQDVGSAAISLRYDRGLGTAGDLAGNGTVNERGQKPCSLHLCRPRISPCQSAVNDLSATHW